MLRKTGATPVFFREILSADDKYIYYNAPGGPGTSGPIDIGLYIFDINIEVPYKAPEVDVDHLRAPVLILTLG